MTTVSTKSPTERVVFADYMRITACFLVMLVHASENFYGADNSGLAGNMSMLLNEQNRLWVALYDGCSRIAVPMFMVLSAFLLVPMRPGMTMGQFYKRRFLHVLPPMVAFMLIYTFMPLLWGGMTWEQSLNDLKTLPFNFPSMAGHLWFMYPLIGVYLFIPIISPWLEKATPREERVFIWLFVLSTFMHYLHRFVNAELWGECFWNQYHMLWNFAGFLGYVVLAHYIRVHIHWSVSRRRTVGLICLIVGSAFTAWSFWLKGVPGQLIVTPDLEWGWEFCTPNVVLSTFGVFLLFSCIQKKQAPRWVTSLSKLSFGMYLMHLLWLHVWVVVFIGEGGAAAPVVPVYAAIPLIAICTFICCAITAKLISLLPGSKWLIGA